MNLNLSFGSPPTHLTPYTPKVEFGVLISFSTIWVRHNQVSWSSFDSVRPPPPTPSLPTSSFLSSPSLPCSVAGRAHRHSPIRRSLLRHSPIWHLLIRRSPIKTFTHMVHSLIWKVYPYGAFTHMACSPMKDVYSYRMFTLMGRSSKQDVHLNRTFIYMEHSLILDLTHTRPSPIKDLHL